QQELFDTNYMEIQKSMIHLKFPDSYRYAEGNINRHGSHAPGLNHFRFGMELNWKNSPWSMGP
ncbi:MAG TPA: hypothetical protein PKB02_13615, partial [Anaerohalosphaeraceae bacterium]|nr:hypothetical protein [Anaerohalosphaeraceae bacterium]